MSTLQAIGNLLSHKEEGRGIRHPLVFTFNVTLLAVVSLLFMTVAEKNAGQTVYFLTLLGLLASSAAYHTWKPGRFLWFLDQTMISLYILATPMPFVHQEWWAWPLFVAMACMTVVNKWVGWEPNYKVGSLVFLLIGILSGVQVFFIGLPNIGVSGREMFLALLIMAASTGMFIGKLGIYHYQFHWPKLRRDIWGPAECGHFTLIHAITTSVYVVISYPV